VRICCVLFLSIIAACTTPPPAPAVLPAQTDSADCMIGSELAVQKACFGSHVVYGVIQAMERRSEPVMDGPSWERIDDCKYVEAGVVMTLQLTESFLNSAPRLDERIEVVMRSVSIGTSGVAFDGQTSPGATVLAVGTTVGMWMNGPVDGFYKQHGQLFTINDAGAISYENTYCPMRHEANTKAELKKVLADCQSAPPRPPLVVATCLDAWAEPAPEGCSGNVECGPSQRCDVPTRRCVP
jgi:hypothetical protein